MRLPGGLSTPESQRTLPRYLLLSGAIHASVCLIVSLTTSWEAPGVRASRPNREATLRAAWVEVPTSPASPAEPEPERLIEMLEPEEPTLVARATPIDAPAPDPRLEALDLPDYDSMFEGPPLVSRSQVAEADTTPRASPPEEPTLLPEASAARASAPPPPATTAVPIHAPPPEYPRVAERRRWEGTALCRLTVQEDGSVSAVELLVSSGREVLDRAALLALRKWRYGPQPDEERTVLQRISFRLRSQPLGHARR